MPERHLAGLAGRRGDDDAFVGDVLDPPGRSAEQERLSRPALVHHLLVELTDPGAVGKEDAVEAPVGDRAATGDREPLCPGATAQRALHPVPHDARPELGELVGRVPAGQQIEHGREDVIGQVGEVGGSPHERRELVDRPVVERTHGDDLLGQHIERVARVPGVLDEPLVHPPHDHGRLDEIRPVLRKDLAAARLADLVTGPTDALQAPRHRARRLDLDDEIDRAHVDAELQ